MKLRKKKKSQLEFFVLSIKVDFDGKKLPHMSVNPIFIADSEVKIEPRILD